MDTLPTTTTETSSVPASSEDQLREQTVLLRQILTHLQEDRRNRRIWSTLEIVFSIVKYAIMAFIAYSLFLFATNLLNDTLTRVEKSVPTLPSVNLQSIPGLDKIQLPSY
ncbi:MAG: hypothetical protein ACK4NC_03635 [Candidatus Gracilibacteria bacterium]